MPKSWKDIILKKKGNAKNLVTLDHHIIRKPQFCSLSKLTGEDLYLILVDTNTAVTTEQGYFENLLETYEFNWKSYIF